MKRESEGQKRKRKKERAACHDLSRVPSRVLAPHLAASTVPLPPPLPAPPLPSRRAAPPRDAAPPHPAVHSSAPRRAALPHRRHRLRRGGGPAAAATTRSGAAGDHDVVETPRNLDKDTPFQVRNHQSCSSRYL